MSIDNIQLITKEISNSIPQLFHDNENINKIVEDYDINKNDIQDNHYINLSNIGLNYDSEDENLLNLMDNITTKTIVPFKK